MAIVRNKKTNDLYRYIGENKFVNLRTGVEGLVPDDKAANVFAINLECTEMFNQYPNIEKLINKLKLKIEHHG